MARPINLDFKRQVLECLKLEYMKNGNQPIAPPYREILEAIGEQPGREEKIYRTIKMLEDQGSISVERHGGRRPNTYRYIKDLPKESYEIRQQVSKDFSGLLEEAMAVNRKFIEYAQSLERKITEVKAENQFIKEKVAMLDFFAVGPDGKELYQAKDPDVRLKSFLEGIKNELQKGEE